MQRRCGWVPEAALTPARIVWARSRASTDQCPKSVVTAGSVEWVERFAAWRRLGASYPERLSAREVEAFLILDQELTEESNHG